MNKLDYEKIGVFGGTFDPPHLGHFEIACASMQQLGLTKVLWLLTPDSPFKTELIKASIEHRAAMVRMVIAPQPKFELSLIETERPGPHYTVDTLKILREIYPANDLTLILGSDSLAQFTQWKNPNQIMQIVTKVAAIHRNKEDGENRSAFDLVLGLKEKVEWIDTPIRIEASHIIRELVKNGKPYRQFVTNEVADHIEKFHLYS